MNLLWITNIILPSLAKAKDMPIPAVGGWMYSSLKRLKIHSDINIAVATVYPGNKFEATEIDGIQYYLLPLRGKSMIRYNQHLEKYWLQVHDDLHPNVIHIHGTEYPHGLAYVRACGPQGVVVSLQGIISCIARYYAAGIDYRSVKKCLTFRDIVKNENILKGQKSFDKRGILEIELLQRVNHIIGRTDWDKSHAWAINPKAAYHYCGETLRDSFYTNKWSYENCEPHSIFVSQASYPIKGVHMLFEALPLILRQYPDAKIYVAGVDPTAKSWYKISGYGNFLKKQIARLGIADHIVFTGMLDEKVMCERYLKSNVFVCCSSIENSPNSLGEAQLLGMPYVASFVGGVPEIVDWNTDVLYRFEEYEMLAQRICYIFAQTAEYTPYIFDMDRYNSVKNASDLLSIYKLINQYT